MDAPTNVLVADLQNGCQVFAKWTAPAGSPAGYYVYKSSSELGSYTKVNASLITDTRYVLPNFSLTDEVFVKVSAEDSGGVESALSSVGNDATINLSPSVSLSATARLNDVIAAGSYFSTRLASGVITLQVTNAFTFDGVVMLWQLDANNYVQFNTDEILYVLGGQTVARFRPEGIYLLGRKIVLTTLGAVIDATEAPFEWVAAQSAIYAIHIAGTDVRLMGVDASGNMYLPEHDSQPMGSTLGVTNSFGLFETGDLLQWGDGFYIMAAIDETEKIFMTRGRIIENVGSL